MKLLDLLPRNTALLLANEGMQTLADARPSVETGAILKIRGVGRKAYQRLRRALDEQQLAKDATPSATARALSEYREEVFASERKRKRAIQKIRERAIAQHRELLALLRDLEPEK